MARIYRISVDTAEKEKAVGGVLTFTQAGWLVLGLLIFFAVFVGLSRALPTALALFIALIPGLGVGLPFAFYEKGGLRLSQYLFWRVKFAKKNKYLVNTLTYQTDRPGQYRREQQLADPLKGEV